MIRLRPGCCRDHCTEKWSCRRTGMNTGMSFRLLADCCGIGECRDALRIVVIHADAAVQLDDPVHIGDAFIREVDRQAVRVTVAAGSTVILDRALYCTDQGACLRSADTACEIDDVDLVDTVGGSKLLGSLTGVGDLLVTLVLDHRRRRLRERRQRIRNSLSKFAQVGHGQGDRISLAHLLGCKEEIVRYHARG